MSEYPDRFVVTAIARPDARDAGKRFWLYWSPEGGGWWQWGPEGWAYRFESVDDKRLSDALACAPKVGPFWAWPDEGSIEVVAVPAIVKVY
jgi:hypothetical protein